MKLFISYSPHDKAQVDELAASLKQGGHEAWSDHSIAEGQRWESVLKEQITSCDAFVCVVSRNSLKSEWCKREFRTAKKAKLPIVVVVIEEAALADLPSDLKKYETFNLSHGATITYVAPLLEHLRSLEQQLTAERERKGARSAPTVSAQPADDEPEMVLPLVAQVVESSAYPELAMQANVLIGRGEWDEALTVLHQLVRDDPNNGTVHSARGSVYGFIGEADKALKDCTKAISLDATLAVAHNNLGVLYNFKDKHEQALACYTAAIALDPTLGDAYQSRGLLYYEADQVNEALADFEKSVELKPDDYGAQNNRAFVLYQLGRAEEAEAGWRAALGLPGAEAHVYANYAVVLEQLGRKDEAVAQYHKAVDMERKWKNQMEHMAEDFRWNAAMVTQARSILKRLRR